MAIFWDPECGFCQRMLPALGALEDDPPAGAPRLALISAGDSDTLRGHELRSAVLLDPGSQAMAAIGARGTPMAVLIDAGMVASPVAAGAEAVFELVQAASRPLKLSGERA